jgi:hypothetical protein
MAKERECLRDLELEMAKTGVVHCCFNLGESITAGRAIIAEHDSEQT